MKRTVFRYGIYAALTIIVLSAIHFFVLMPNVNYDIAEIGGYLTMLLSMIFVFMGIRYYRDHVNNGSLSFAEGLKIGVLIVLVPSVFFGLFDVLYTEVLNPSWKQDYFNYYVEQAKASTPPAQLEAKLKELEKGKEMFGSPAFQFILMAGTVFVIGLIVTIISTLTLRRNKRPATA